jgi:hypothetical protein
MLTLSVLWVVLAAAVTMIATFRKEPPRIEREAVSQVRESGRTLTFLALIYGIVLLAGFAYISKFLVSML